MATIGSPQSSAGIVNFYDAQTTGPKFNPKIVLVVVVAFVIVVLALQHILPFG